MADLPAPRAYPLRGILGGHGRSLPSCFLPPGSHARQEVDAEAPPDVTFSHQDFLRPGAEYMPAAARDALEAMELMASTGFNYGRLTRKGAL